MDCRVFIDTVAVLTNCHKDYWPSFVYHDWRCQPCVCVCVEMRGVVWYWWDPVNRRLDGSVGGTLRMSHCYRPSPSRAPFIVAAVVSHQNWTTLTPCLLLYQVSFSVTLYS